MKKIIILSSLILTSVLFATSIVIKTVPAPSNIASNTTNSTAQASVQLSPNQTAASDPIRLYVSASGAAATTNGTLIVRFGLSYDGVNWDNASGSAMQVTMSTLGATTNQVSDWFVLGGARFLRVASVENTFAGAVTNLSVTVSGNLQDNP